MFSECSTPVSSVVYDPIAANGFVYEIPRFTVHNPFVSRGPYTKACHTYSTRGRIMSQHLEPTHRLNDPDFRQAEAAMKRAAEKAQRQAREAGLEPVVRQTEETKKPDQDGQKR